MKFDCTKCANWDSELKDCLLDNELYYTKGNYYSLDCPGFEDANAVDDNDLSEMLGLWDEGDYDDDYREYDKDSMGDSEGIDSDYNFDINEEEYEKEIEYDEPSRRQRTPEIDQYYSDGGYESEMADLEEEYGRVLAKLDEIYDKKFRDLEIKYDMESDSGFNDEYEEPPMAKQQQYQPPSRKPKTTPFMTNEEREMLSKMREQKQPMKNTPHKDITPTPIERMRQRQETTPHVDDLIDTLVDTTPMDDEDDARSALEEARRSMQSREDKMGKLVSSVKKEPMIPGELDPSDPLDELRLNNQKGSVLGDIQAFKESAKNDRSGLNFDQVQREIENMNKSTSTKVNIEEIERQKDEIRQQLNIPKQQPPAKEETKSPSNEKNNKPVKSKSKK